MAKTATHVGMIKRWAFTSLKAIRLYESEYYWISEDGRLKWGKNSSKIGPPEKHLLGAGENRSTLLADTIRPITRDELREPLVQAVETAESSVRWCEQRIAEVKDILTKDLDVLKAAKERLAKFDAQS